jgi:N-acetylmuramoyl-L-alanine amidase
MTPRRRVVLVAAAVLAVCAFLAVAFALVPTPDDVAPPPPARPTEPAASSPAPSTVPAPTATEAPPPLAGRVVVLDPGHNRDNGRHTAEIGRPVDAGGFQKACNTTGTATNSGIPEATVNWDLAVAVQARLQTLGATVTLTRDADAGWGPCIDERAAIANRTGADLLLSLHADGTGPGVRGFHVITPGTLPGWTDDIAVASRRAGLAVRDALVAAGLSPANYVAHDGLDERTDLGTLNRADVPAIMLEAGNLRNADDAALLTDEAGRARVADALAAAVAAFLTGGS